MCHCKLEIYGLGTAQLASCQGRRQFSAKTKICVALHFLSYMSITAVITGAFTQFTTSIFSKSAWKNAEQCMGMRTKRWFFVDINMFIVNFKQAERVENFVVAVKLSQFPFLDWMICHFKRRLTFLSFLYCDDDYYEVYIIINFLRLSDILWKFSRRPYSETMASERINSKLIKK